MTIEAGAVLLPVEPDTRGFGRHLRRGVDRESGRIRGAGRRVGSAIATGIAAIGVGALLADEIGNALNADVVNDKLAASYDLTEREAAKAGRISGRLFGDAYGDSLGEINAAFAGIEDNIDDLGSFTDRELRDMGQRALDLSTILEEDVGRATRAVGQLIRNGLARDATEAFDLITRAVQEGGNATDDLVDTIEEYSTDFAALGLDGAEALGSLSAALDAGARNADLAADALRELSIRAIDGSQATAEGFELAGLNAEEMADKIAAGGPTARQATSEIIRAVASISDPIAQEAAGVALFGTRFEELGPTVIAAMDPLEAKLGDVAGATDRMGERLNDNAQTNITAFRRQITTLATEALGGVVIPALQDTAAEVESTLGPAWDDAAAAVERSSGDQINSARDLFNTVTDDSRSFGTRFGIIWDDIWTENTAREQRNMDLFLASWVDDLERWIASTDDYQARWRGRWRRTLGGWLADTDDWQSKWLARMRRAYDATIGATFRFGLRIGSAIRGTFDGLAAAARDRLDDIVGFFRALPDRIAGAVRSLRSTITDRVADVFRGISIKLPFSLTGDGFGVPGDLGRPGGSLMGVSPQSAVGRAYTLLGRPGDVTSGLRPGAITATGNRSYHSMGRALDITPSMAIFNLIRERFGAVSKELIYSPAGGRQIWNGRPHMFTGVTRANHFDHIHWAMGRGGLVRRGPTEFLVGEHGPEKVTLPPASVVTPYDQLVRGGDGPGIASGMPAGPIAATIDLGEGHTLATFVRFVTGNDARVIAQRARAGVR